MYICSEFFSQAQIEKIETKAFRPQVLISITSPLGRGSRPAQLHDVWDDVLRLEFHDVVPSRRANEKVTEPKIYFSEANATSVINFLKKNENLTQCELLVHCEAGVSRSAAVAKFAAQLYSLEFPTTYDRYNRYVFSTLISVYYRALNKEASSSTKVTS